MATNVTTTVSSPVDTGSTKITIYTIGAFVALTAWLILKDRSLNLPDGPRGLPLVGNMFSMNDGTLLHLKLTEWSRQYGDFYCYMLGRAPVVVLNSPQTISDLFVKRGNKYSSRPRVSNQASIITQDARIVAIPYGEQWRKHRKAFHELLNMQNAKMFLPYQEYESRRTLKNLLEAPTGFWREVTRYSASVTFSLLLGCRFDSADTLIPQEINKRMLKMFKAIRPGAWLVDWLPFLDCLPDALAPWRKSAVDLRTSIMQFFLVFYNVMKERVRNGTAPDCFLARLLEQEGSVFDESEPPHMIGTTMAAGTDTTATTLQFFFKAAILFPDAIKKAQEEIDQVVGPHRLPGWEDRKNLPYIEAAINETHRWATATPLAFIHATSEADVYRGKDIPGGTIVYSNIYAVHNDPNVFARPEEWIPERYLPASDNRAAPEANHAGTHYAFGAGRRECPGRHVADASLYIVISRMLWAFDIVGNPKKPPQPGYSGAFPVFGPVEFEATVKPRSDAAARLVRNEAEINRPADMEDSTVYDDLVAKLPPLP
ncbi:hypothetical protein PV08_09514 [Exophiala spinifera]|uniref:Cytochrome P450 n=1 Tax=Exophiala spinifera TaxID=91928 RepID=A0A0D2AZS7_9EURO|nr:uncharacterized protein PV08_09514 [Exophiala spinifera]KIW12238.1 hypothetical protein PV08_09514 [Exophiala spinifera]